MTYKARFFVASHAHSLHGATATRAVCNVTKDRYQYSITLSPTPSLYSNTIDALILCQACDSYRLLLNICLILLKELCLIQIVSISLMYSNLFNVYSIDMAKVTFDKTRIGKRPSRYRQSTNSKLG